MAKTVKTEAEIFKEEFKKKVTDKKIFEVSGATKEGLQDVVNYLGKILKENLQVAQQLI